uniref:GST N-terminal domain-containing protein n=1 Tax=Vombatus ursinus TaxID=29139 RepID=A0A4X2L5C9_VOMUR
MVLNLYLNLFSSSCRSLYIFAKLHVISFEMIPVDLMKGQRAPEKFVQISPLKKVPVMKDEDFVLGESVAIMLYLCRRFKTPDHWYPDDAEGCALVDEYLAWQHLNMKKHCKKVLLWGRVEEDERVGLWIWLRSLFILRPWSSLSCPWLCRDSPLVPLHAQPGGPGAARPC